MAHVCHCRGCSPERFPPEDAPRIDEHHINFQRKRGWVDLLSEVYINGEREFVCFQASDGEESWALRVTPPEGAHTNIRGAIQPHRCSCLSGKPCIEMVFGGVTIKRPTPEQIEEAKRYWSTP